MPGVVRLRALPPFGLGTYTEYFYEGEAKCINGIIEVPANRPEWVGALLASNYEIIKEEASDGETAEDVQATQVRGADSEEQRRVRHVRVREA